LTVLLACHLFARLLTAAIFQLYSRRDDLVDDDDEEDHISEYMCVNEFCDSLEMAHTRNYASAAYRALTTGSALPVDHFDEEDFTEVLRPLRFVEVAQVTLACDRGDDFGMRSKLSRMIETVLGAIPNQAFCLYYRGDECKDVFPPHLDDDSDSISTLNAPLELLSDDEESSRKSSVADGESSRDDELTHAFDIGAITSTSAPLFVRFMVDDTPVSVHDVAVLAEDSSLSIALSVFDEQSCFRDEGRKPDTAHLPGSHLNPAVELAGLLNAFEAEQTLERLRLHGPASDDKDYLKLAKSCLRKARDVVTSTIEIFFYVGKLDDMIPASAPAGCDAEIEVGFEMLREQLMNNDQLPLRPFSGGFVAVSDPAQWKLDYWCFLNVRKGRAVVTVEIHHPKGTDEASEVLSNVHETISMCCHRVNQLRLLQRLHESRVASTLLIPPDEQEGAESYSGIAASGKSPFRTGLFSCPVVFRTSFDLFHRCATNPSQVARTIEATVLHVFATNRPHIFVYRDETASIFYMKLVARGGGIEPDGTIDLVVYGIDIPGPSVTRQLTTILKKRLLSIAVDMLSSVLTKNPYYYWRKADLAFVQSYEETVKALEDDAGPSGIDRERTYVIPGNAIDPLMQFLFFRQNFAGSTFCHTLKSLEWSGSTTASVDVEKEDAIRLDGLNFVFYYNNAPSKVNPKFQGRSTLTDKGAAYSREVGTGIGIIEIELLDSYGGRVRAVSPHDTMSETKSPLANSSQSIRLLKVDEAYPNIHGSKYGVRVKITDTALKRDVLHDWVWLSFNQAMVSCAAERHLECIQRGRWSSQAPIMNPKDSAVEMLSPGLPGFSDLLSSAIGLPHPACLKLELQGVVRSSAVATAALDLLEGTIFDQLLIESRNKWPGKISETCIIRLSRGESPCRVSLGWDSGKKHAEVRDISESSAQFKVIRDAPIDCPEYLCFYYCPEYGDDVIRSTGVSLPKLFEKVALTDGSDESTDLLQSLEALKRTHPALFRRSFAFIFSVKRNRRLLLSYNWTPEAFKSTTARLKERNNALLLSTNQSMNNHQKRCLRELSPLPVSYKPAVLPRNESRAGKLPPVPKAPDSKPAERSEQGVRPGRRVARPTGIRRPKLIGRSVEGAALHAVAASRARASSNMFKSTSATADSSPRKGSAPSNSRRPSQADRLSNRKLEARSPDSFTRNDSDALVKAHAEFNSSMLADTGAILRLHSLQQRSILLLMARLWPIQQERSIPRPVAQFLLSNQLISWSDIAELPQMPKRILTSFVTLFGRTLAAWTPGLSLLSVAPNTRIRLKNSILLMGDVKFVRNRRCAGVVRVSLFHQTIGGQRKCFIRCSGWGVSFPLAASGTKASGVKTKYNSQELYEKDSAGIDKLASVLHNALPLHRMIFDFLSSIVEHTVRSPDPALRYSDAFELAQKLLAQYEFRQQLEMPHSNFKIFQTSIFLASYKDVLIDSFEAPVLFNWLMTNAESRGTTVCGKALCFKTEIIVRGTHSMCFLISDGTRMDKMDLILLCRTQGRDILEWTFRDGSYVAISILDCISYDAAGIAYAELHFAASRLRLDALWRQVSGRRPSKTKPSSANIKEMLSYCSVQPITEVLGSLVSQQSQVLTMLKDGIDIDWRSCSATMERDLAFSPSWKVQESDDEQTSILFYLGGEDIFLLFKTDAEGRTFEVSTVNRDDNPEERLIAVVQKFLNFVMHFVWSDIL